jgi:6-phosphogluconate dehydrogenase
MNKNLIIIVLMGVSGCGKTTIGKILSKEKNIPFFDADDYHPKENIKMMKEGKPLNDKNRLPWLIKINNLIKKNSQVSSCIIACSSLKKKYRSIIKKNITIPIHFIYLKGNKKLIQERIKKRKNHFMNNSLLRSQLNTLEEPSNSLIIDVNKNPKKIISIITNKIFFNSKILK